LSLLLSMPASMRVVSFGEAIGRNNLWQVMEHEQLGYFAGSVREYPVPPELDDPRLRAMFDYWLSKFRGDRLPAWKDIDPVEIPRLLGHINVSEVLREDGWVRFRFRLWGTKITDLYGRDYTGLFVEDIMAPGMSEAVQRVFEHTVRTGLSHFWQIPVPVENREFISNRRLLLPLSGGGETVDFLLGFMIGDRR
jgi:hypothetical protein